MYDKFESPPDLLTVNEAALMLRLQISTIRSWVLKRRVPFVKLGGKRVFFRRADLEALIKASVVPAKESPEGQSSEGRTELAAKDALPYIKELRNRFERKRYE